VRGYSSLILSAAVVVGILLTQAHDAGWVDLGFPHLSR